MSSINQMDLKSVSDKFTEETLKDILAKKYNGQNVKIVNWDFGSVSAKGDSYLSTIDKIKINGIVNDKSVETSIVVKSLPKNVGRKKTFRSAEFFRNEIIFYTEVIPKFEKFLLEKGQSQLLHVPQHLASLTDGENDFLVLEDVTPLGYGPATRQSCLDLNQCTFIVKAMATFHGISFAFKDQHKEEFKEITKNIKETYFNKWSWYKRFHEKLVGIAKHALATEYPDSAALKRFLSFEFGYLYERSRKLTEDPNGPTCIINQGDSWAPNFLVREIDGGKKEVLMLDFQLARCVSPILDLAFLIYSCTDKEFRDQYFEEILDVYYKELSKTISVLESDPEKVYSRETFLKEVQENFIHGVTFSMESIPFSLLTESESFDLDKIKGDEELDICDVWTLTNIQTKHGRQRLADVFVHAVEKGFL